MDGWWAKYKRESYNYNHKYEHDAKTRGGMRGNGQFWDIYHPAITMRTIT
jgi:hypothetical protein